MTIDETGFPKTPDPALWRRTANMIIENPTKQYCVRQAFGTWCVLSPFGNVLGMHDLWGDALSECDNVYIAWAERYCRFLNTDLYTWCREHKRHPVFEIDREITRQGQDRVFVSLAELEAYKQRAKLAEPEFELDYESGEYEP